MVNKLRKKPRNGQNNYTKADYIAAFPYLFPEALREVRFPASAKTNGRALPEGHQNARDPVARHQYGTSGTAPSVLRQSIPYTHP